MTRQSVFVVGSLHYDIVLQADHLPALDETVMGTNVQFVCGGKGGNQAVAASQHGAQVDFAGLVGEDFFATALLKNLQDAGVNTDQIRTSNQIASGMSVAIVEPAGNYGAVVASGANQFIDAELIELPNDLDILILQNEVAEEINKRMAKCARELGARVVLNAAPMRALPEELLMNVDILIVNRLEAEALFAQTIASKDDALNALQANPLDVETVIITLGGDGLVFASGKNDAQFIAPHSVETISSHGAGDSFVGALSARLAMGDAMPAALEYASCAAALHVATRVDARSQIDPTAVREQMRARIV